MKKRTERIHEPQTDRQIKQYQDRLITYLSNNQKIDTQEVLAYIEKIPEFCIDSGFEKSIQLLTLIAQTQNKAIILAAYKKFPEDERLLLAAACGWKDAVYSLLDKGVSANVQAYSGATPLYLASRYGHEECVQLLLRAGAQVNNKTKIYSLIDHNKADAIKHKIASGLDPSITSPLCAATAGKHYNIMKMLLKKGADPAQLSPYGYALAKTSYACTEVLNDEKVSKGLHDYTAAHIAAKNNDIIALRLLKRFGAKMNYSAAFEQCKWGNLFGAIEKYHTASTPMHAAVSSGSVEAASFLLQDPAQVNQKACDKLPYIRADGSISDSRIGLTPLHLAGLKGNAAMTKLLLMHGATVNHAGRRPVSGKNMYDYKEWTPLDCAVVYGQNLDTIRMLKEQGASMNCWDDHMHYAVTTNHVWLVQQLLNLKKDKPLHLNTYLSLAVSDNSVEIARLFILRGAEINEGLIKTAQDSDYPLMLELLNAHKPIGMNFANRVKRFFCLPADSDPAPRNDTYFNQIQS